VALLQGGGAVFVWQGGQTVSQHIYAQFLSSSNTFLTTNDVLVNTFTNNFQINPAVATLTNGNVVIVWGSFDQVNSGSMQDVYGRIFSPAGQPIAGEFLINQFTPCNQRTPTVTALANGGFVVAWVSEQERVAAPNPGAGTFTVTSGAVAPNPSVDIYARLYDANGNPQNNELWVNGDSNPCAHPSVAAGTDGGFMIAWDAFDMTSPTTNSLDIYARSFTSAGSSGTVVRVNTYLYGDQYAPRISSLGTDYLIVWTSLAQGGSRKGVYGQFLSGAASKVGSEFRVDAKSYRDNIQPVVVSDGVSRFLAVWASYAGAPYGFDLYAQRYASTTSVLQPMAAPFVYVPFTTNGAGVYQPQLVVSWPPELGLSISTYEVYVDGATTPMALTTNTTWTMTAAAGSFHSFKLDYVTTDGRTSPISPSASGMTWSGRNWGGIPYEWMEEYYSDLGVAWPTNMNAPIPPGGPTVYQVFLSGGNPNDPSTWLRTTLDNSANGLYLDIWNMQPGLTYQVQVTTNLTTWSVVPNASAKYAVSTSDSVYVGGSSAGYYRVMLLR
jgi:hypothetical protein